MISNFNILRLIMENNARKQEVVETVEKETEKETEDKETEERNYPSPESLKDLTSPLRFIGVPATYRLFEECGRCGQNKHWCVCHTVLSQ